jgi:hypothetical protein
LQNDARFSEILTLWVAEWRNILTPMAFSAALVAKVAKTFVLVPNLLASFATSTTPDPVQQRY